MIIKLPKKVNIFKVIFKLSAVALVLSIFLQMYVTNKLAVKGAELVELDNRKVQLEKEIAKFEFEDSSLSSLAYIENKAKETGFVKLTDDILAIKVPATAAVLPSF
jgi:cell division protein FtsB